MCLKLISAISVLLISTFAFADVISLDNGLIYLGEIKSTDWDRDSVVINSFGETKTLNTSNIISTEKNFNNVSNKKIEILLKDNSRLKGKLKDYDEDIGVLIDTDFGTVTLPSKGIKTIIDSDRRSKYSGHSVLLGISGAVYFPITDFASKFTIDPLFSVFVELNSFFLRGIFFGVDFTYMMMNYTPNELLTYNAYQFKFYITYRLLHWRTSDSISRIFIPYFSFGIGTSYNTLTDNRPSAVYVNRNEMDLLISGAVGLDINIWGPLMIRIQGSWFTLNERSNFLHAFTVNVGFVVGF